MEWLGSKKCHISLLQLSSTPGSKDYSTTCVSHVAFYNINTSRAAANSLFKFSIVSSGEPLSRNIMLTSLVDMPSILHFSGCYCNVWGSNQWVNLICFCSCFCFFADRYCYCACVNSPLTTLNNTLEHDACTLRNTHNYIMRMRALLSSCEAGLMKMLKSLSWCSLCDYDNRALLKHTRSVHENDPNSWYTAVSVVDRTRNGLH